MTPAGLLTHADKQLLAVTTLGGEERLDLDCQMFFQKRPTACLAALQYKSACLARLQAALGLAGHIFAYPAAADASRHGPGFRRQSQACAVPSLAPSRGRRQPQGALAPPHTPFPLTQPFTVCDIMQADVHVRQQSLQTGCMQESVTSALDRAAGWVHPLIGF